MDHLSNGRSPRPKRILAAPVPLVEPENGRDPLLEAYDELNAMWKAAEIELQGFRVPVDVTIQVHGESFIGGDDDPDGTEVALFGFVKHNDQWRICVGVFRDMYREPSYWQWKPIAESPIEKRVEMAVLFEDLRSKVLEARDKFFPKVSRAIAELKKSLGK